MWRWQRNLQKIFAQWIRLLYQAQKYAWKINYILSGEIYSEYIELNFSFVHPCIGKLRLVVEAPVDFIPNGMHMH